VPTSNIPTFQHSKTPRHVAIIMDGNGRWAKKRGLPRYIGHKQGAEAVRRVVKNAADAGVEYLTLFGFSSENWSRPSDEIQELMKLLRQYLLSETTELHKNNVRLKVIGDRSAFDADIVQLITNAEAITKQNDGIQVIMALNYGGRHDIAQAARQMMVKAVGTGMISDVKTIELEFNSFMMTADLPDPDLLIRTSGEKRISNFLLWQCAYAEMVFSPVLWPDFDKKEFLAALEEYASRDRRFGALKQQEA
jgi:undecaprenyl diphosphate synthase